MSVKGRCVIISGGDFTSAADIRGDDYIIACDRGVDHARRLGVLPDLIVGDFDSFTGALPAGVPVLRLPCEKDDTDTMHAVRCALDRGFGEILLTCALGGRFDHGYANIQSCVYAARRGLSVSVADDTTQMLFLRGEASAVLPLVEGSSLSLFAAGERCTGVSVSGVKYPLDHARLDCDFPLGVSNAWTAPEARVSVESGVLMIVMSRL